MSSIGYNNRTQIQNLRVIQDLDLEGSLSINGVSQSLATLPISSSNISNTVINVSDFGAVGDGITDDTVAIQNAINAAMAATSGIGLVVFNGDRKTYLISSRLEVQPYVYTGPAPASNDQAFFKTQSITLTSYSNCEIKASIPLPNGMLRVGFNPVMGDGGYHIKIENLQFNGNSGAYGSSSNSMGIIMDYAFYNQILKCRFYNLRVGVYCQGVAVQNYSHNVFKCMYGLVLGGINTSGGADSIYTHNDFYCAKYGIVCRGYSGDSVFFKNQFTAEQSTVDLGYTPKGILFDCYAISDNAEIYPYDSSYTTALRTVQLGYYRVKDNLFDGLIYSIESNSSTLPLQGVIISGNIFKNSPNAGYAGSKKDIILINCDSNIITENHFRGLSGLANKSSDYAIDIQNSIKSNISNNNFEYCGVLQMTNNVNCIVSSNIFYDAVKNGVSTIYLSSGNSKNIISYNNFEKITVNSSKAIESTSSSNNLNTYTNNSTTGYATSYLFNGTNAINNFNRDGTTTDVLTIANTTDSSSSTTGSVKISGGVGIAKNLYIGGAAGLSIQSALGNRALSIQNGGSLRFALGIADAESSGNAGSNLNLFSYDDSGIYLGAPLNINRSSGNIFLSSTTSSTANNTGSLMLSGGLAISKTTDAVSITNGGTITTAGGAAIAKSLYVGGNLNITGNITAGTWNGSSLTVPYGGSGQITLNTNAVLLGNGTGAIQSPSTITYSSSTLTLPKITSNDTTASTSNTTGAVLLSGGLGISLTTDATSSTNGGTITTAGGLAVAKKLFVGTDITTSSTSNLFINNISTTASSNIFNLITTGTISTSRIYLNSGSNTSQYTNQFFLYGLGTPAATDNEAFRIAVSSSDISFSNTKAGTGINKSLSLYAGNSTGQLTLLTNNTITCNDTTASSSSTAGALKLSGGLSLANTTEATSSTNGGTITTAGGVAIAKKLFIGGDLTLTGNLIKNSVDILYTYTRAGLTIDTTLTTQGATFTFPKGIYILNMFISHPTTNNWMTIAMNSSGGSANWDENYYLEVPGFSPGNVSTRKTAIVSITDASVNYQIQAKVGVGTVSMGIILTMLRIYTIP